MMSDADWVIIADDLTGACDAAAAFASRGWSTMVGFSAGALRGGAIVRALSAATRSQPPEQAAVAVEQAALALIRPADRVYKKIDSTLRGHPGVELRALMSALPSRGLQNGAVLVCPAFPQQGRVVLDGQVYIRGVPLAETEFAAAVPETNLAKIFAPCRTIGLEAVRAGADVLAGILNGPGVYVADAETAEDLQILADAGERAGVRMFCGSSGLSSALARRLQEGCQRLDSPKSDRAVLMISGSRSQATALQLAALRERGAVEIRAEEWSAAETTAIVIRIASLLERSQDVVISTADLPWSAGNEEQVSARLGSFAMSVLKYTHPGGMVLTGGDTASAVLHSMGCGAFHLGGEVQPGIVWGVLADGPYRGLPVVTKAGGFGGPNTLYRAARFLRGDE